jgi:hypothetical protein
MRGEGVKGREEGGGSGGKGVEEEGREWWGGSGDAGPSLPFVVGARRCLGWCWAAVAVRRWCVWALVAVRLWRASLPFVAGAHRCRSLLARVVAVFHWRAPLLFAVGACRCLGARSLFVGGRSSSSVGGALSSVDGGRCCPWGVVVVMDGALLWSVGAHRSGGGSLLSRGVVVSVHDRHP